ncbi:hypothetical protein BGX27_000398 [Mortierella sp. AM989]|nr:hypothetical protein BGX27_000398 [Mortierella sp. AM989]
MGYSEHQQENAGQQSTPLFLGLDLSTQQLKVIALQPANHSSSLETHSSFAVHFDSDLSHYNTRGGVTIQQETEDVDPENRGVVTTPVLMWIEALSLVLDRMKESAFPFERVQAISGAAQSWVIEAWYRKGGEPYPIEFLCLINIETQQHGSVYWSSNAREAFQAMETSSNRDLTLVEISKSAFTLYQSPIWQDTSTAAQCREIEEYLGTLDQGSNQELDLAKIRLHGQQRLAELTGSRAYERYTGSQILKIVQKCPDIYNSTKRISLVSSFLSSLLMGQYAMIDPGDGSGMNMLNIDSKTWDPLLTEFIGQGGAKNQIYRESKLSGTLEDRLGEVEGSGKKVQGVISKWFADQYGFRPDVNIVTFTGDNPATVMAMQAEQGDAIVSLGTSDTLLLYTNHHGLTPSLIDENNKENQANARLSVGYLCHPIDPRGYLMMYCAKNGSLAREKIRDLYADGKWDQFNRYLNDSMQSEHQSRSVGRKDDSFSRTGFYFFDREIWPPIKGVYRFQGEELVEEFGSESNGSSKQRANVLAVCESQFLAMRVRSSQGSTSAPTPSEKSLSPPGISRILATGGASSNRTILQLLSNVFGVPVLSMSDSEQKGAGSAGWGAARKAFLFGRQDIGTQADRTKSENSDFHQRRTDESGAITPDLEQTRIYVERIPEFLVHSGMALFHEHTWQLKAWARRTIWFFVVTGSLCAIVIPIFSIYRNEGDNARSVVEVGAQGVSHTGNYIHVVGSVASVDFEDKNFRVHFEFTPYGTLTGDDGILTESVVVSLFYTTLTFPDGQIMRAVDVTMPYMQGATIDYPFDSYKSYFEILANKERQRLHKIPVSLTFLGMLQSVEFVPTVRLSNLDLYKISIEIITRRSPTTIGFSLFIVLIMWMLSIAIGIIAIQVIRQHRMTDEHVLTLGITTLFALPALRETQPGIPAIGCAADVLGFYWNMAIIAIASILILMTSALRWKAPSIEKELKMIREQHDHQSKLIKEMVIPMPFPLTGGPFYDYQNKQTKMPSVAGGFLGTDHLDQRQHQYYHPCSHPGCSESGSERSSIHDLAHQGHYRHYLDHYSDEESLTARQDQRSTYSEAIKEPTSPYCNASPRQFHEDSNLANSNNNSSTNSNGSHCYNSGSSTLDTQYARRHESKPLSPSRLPDLMSQDRRAGNLSLRQAPGPIPEPAPLRGIRLH